MNATDPTGEFAIFAIPVLAKAVAAAGGVAIGAGAAYLAQNPCTEPFKRQDECDLISDSLQQLNDGICDAADTISNIVSDVVSNSGDTITDILFPDYLSLFSSSSDTRATDTTGASQAAEDNQTNNNCPLPTAPGMRRQDKPAPTTILETVIGPLAQAAGIDVCFNQSHIRISDNEELAEIDIEFANMLVEVKEGDEYYADHVKQLRENYNNELVNYPNWNKQVVYFAPDIELGRHRRNALATALPPEAPSYKRNFVYDQRELDGASIEDFARFLLSL